VGGRGVDGGPKRTYYFLVAWKRGSGGRGVVCAKKRASRSGCVGRQMSVQGSKKVGVACVWLDGGWRGSVVAVFNPCERGKALKSAEASMDFTRQARKRGLALVDGAAN